MAQGGPCQHNHKGTEACATHPGFSSQALSKGENGGEVSPSPAKQHLRTVSPGLQLSKDEEEMSPSTLSSHSGNLWRQP